MTKKQKIFNLSLLFVMLGLVIYLSLSLNKKEKDRVDVISLEGNIHLSKEQYFEFANIIDRNQYSGLTTEIIKDRLRKHPYVAKLDVRYDGSGKVSVKLIEKNFESILLNGDKQFLVTDNLQILPMLPKTRRIDYPVIINPVINNLVSMKYYKNNEDILTASKIISAVKLINPELYDGLSSVDMQTGGDIMLEFSFINYPVIIGRGSEIRRTIYFNNLWTYLKGKEINNIMKYVDLRYGGHVYLGIRETSNEGDKTS